MNKKKSVSTLNPKEQGKQESAEKKSVEKKGRGKVAKSKLGLGQDKKAIAKSKDKKRNKKVKHSFLKKVANYFKDLKTELKRVVWPPKQRVFRSTIVVLTTVAVIAVIVVVLDLGFQNLLKLLLGKL